MGACTIVGEVVMFFVVTGLATWAIVSLVNRWAASDKRNHDWF